MGEKGKRAGLIFGYLNIPEGREEIREREFEGLTELLFVTVPGSVKKIGQRAFADCVNLRGIVLKEGIVSIEANAFSGCRNLRSMKLPYSLTGIGGGAFYGSGLKEAVLSASGDRLVYCPAAAAGTRYEVPETVREIGTHAFIFLPNLREVRLPEGLAAIRSRAFTECGIREIVLPDSVETVERSAFHKCRDLTKIRRKTETDPVRARLEALEMQGLELLLPYELELPEEEHWEDPAFRALAQACASGKAEAMQEMADCFGRMSGRDPGSKFYLAAFRFWTFRAYEWGSEAAKEYLRGWFERHPEDERMISPFLSNRLRGAGSGTQLRALGFYFFQEDRYYSLEGMDEDGAVRASAWAGEDGPDEDGFGREEYYDIWYLDDCLTLPPAGECLEGYSTTDAMTGPGRERFRKQREIAVSSVKCPGRRGHSFFRK